MTLLPWWTGRHPFRLPGIITCLCFNTVGCHKLETPGPTSPTAASTLAQPASPWLEDATERLGLNFVHDAGRVGTYFMPESLGSGVAVFDFDADGRMDILLLQNAGTNAPARHQLFHQDADGRFRDVSSGSGLDLPGLGMGVAIGDIDNDGLPDVFITEYDRVRLLHNRGAGRFTEITRPAGTAGWI